MRTAGRVVEVSDCPAPRDGMGGIRRDGAGVQHLLGTTLTGFGIWNVLEEPKFHHRCIIRHLHCIPHLFNTPTRMEVQSTRCASQLGKGDESLNCDRKSEARMRMEISSSISNAFLKLAERRLRSHQQYQQPLRMAKVEHV